MLENGDIQHLQQPENHGDPVGSGKGILTFGWELLDQLSAIGFAEVQTVDYWSMQFGYKGLCVLFTAQTQRSRQSENGLRRQSAIQKTISSGRGRG